MVVSFDEAALDTVGIIANIFNVKDFSFKANMITDNKDMMHDIIVGRDFSIDSKVCNNIKDIEIWS